MGDPIAGCDNRAMRQLVGGSSCSTLTFSSVEVPQVPNGKRARGIIDFVPPLKTFFTVDNGYDFRARGGATVAPSGPKLSWWCERHPGLVGHCSWWL
jgi:hypothetical protein